MKCAKIAIVTNDMNVDDEAEVDHILVQADDVLVPDTLPELLGAVGTSTTDALM